MNKEDNKSLVIFGAGGHAVSVLNVAISAGFNVQYFVDNVSSKKKLFGIPVMNRLMEHQGKINVAIAVGSNYSRETIYKELVARSRDINFPSLIHQSAILSLHSRIDEGVVVMPNSTIGPNCKIGKFCIINTHASIDHDSTMHDFSSLAPNATTGGNVQVGYRSAISISAVIKHEIFIGDDSIIGANSYLNRNLASNCIAYGSPARVIRKRKSEDPYL